MSIEISFPSSNQTDQQIIIEHRLKEIIKKYCNISSLKVFDCDYKYIIYTYHWWFPFLMNKTIFKIKNNGVLLIELGKSNLSVSDTKLMCEEMGKLFNKEKVQVVYSKFDDCLPNF